MNPRLFIYALGGGNGHALRGSALAAACRALGVEARVWVRDPCVALARRFTPDVIGCPRPRSAAELRQSLLRLLGATAATHLLLDTFPEGVLGELAGSRLNLPRAALLRLRRETGDEFVSAARACELCFDLEPQLAWLPETLAPQSLATAPVVRPLTPAAGRYDVVLCADTPAMFGFCQRLAVRLASRGVVVALVHQQQLRAAGEVRFVPLLGASELCARVVLGRAGFNLSYELSRLGTAHVAIPAARRHDDQRRRALALADLPESPAEAEHCVLQRLEQGRSAPAAHVNTSVDLARTLIERWCGAVPDEIAGARSL